MNNTEYKMDYKNGKIYKIVSDLTDLIYIGSTCSPLSKRLHGHKQSFKTGKNKCTSIELFKLGEARIELIEDFPCERKEQLNAREGYHIKLNKDICVNRNIAGRTIKEYREDNKAKILESKKKYNKKYNKKLSEDNKAKILEYNKSVEKLINERY